MNMVLSIIVSVLNLIAALLHMLGCYLLTCQYKDGQDNPQQLFLINLSISEGTLNFLQLLTNHPANKDANKQTVQVVQTVQHYVKTLRGYGFNTVYLLTMIYLTLDKLIDIQLNIRYHLYWNERKTKKLLILTWCVTLSSAITVSIIHHYTQFPGLEILDLYIYPTLNVVFLVVASLAYGFIFYKYKKSRIPPVRLKKESVIQRQLRTFKVFQRSRFYIPVLLITSFIFLMALPDFIQLRHVSSGGTHDSDVVLTTSLRIVWALSYLVDAVIYIWMKTSVRKLLRRKLGLVNRVHVTGSYGGGSVMTSVHRTSITRLGSENGI